MKVGIPTILSNILCISRCVIVTCPEIVMQTAVFRFYYVATVTGIQDGGHELLLREFRGFMTREGTRT